MKRQSLSKSVEQRRKHFAAKFLITIMLLGMLSVSQTFANNLSIGNVTYDLTAQTVTFDLSWDHSWHNKSGTPNNWDAAWVFVKWRDCLATNAMSFTHGLVSTALTDHNFNVSAGAITYEPTKKDGTREFRMKHGTIHRPTHMHRCIITQMEEITTRVCLAMLICKLNPLKV